MADFLPNITSSKDWPESWKDLQTIDSLLRCSICGEFFKNTAFIPSCSHNYCSLCIRRYLCVDSKCPICGINVQESQLGSNRIIDEIVKGFMKIRHELLEVITNSCNNVDKRKKNTEVAQEVKKKDDKKSRFFTRGKISSSQPVRSSQKRHRKDSSASDKSSSDDRWSPPVDKKKRKLKQSDIIDDTSESDEISIIENPPVTPKRSPGQTSLTRLGKECKTQGKDEDLVDCPVCGQKISQSRINFHLDTCLNSKERKNNLRTSTLSQSPVKQDLNKSQSHVGANSFIPQVSKRKPLNKLVYTLLSNNDLKRKMKEHGLSIKGDRQTLVKRHQEFTIMYNSECSKPKPKSVPEIVRLVEQGERKKNKPVENRDKLNFERGQNQEEIDKIKSEYMQQNENEFTRLISEIRSRRDKDKSSDKKSDKSSSSKTDETPSTSKEKFVVKLLPSKSDEETASNSSADFEPVQRYNTPRRQLRASTEKRRTRSSAKILDEIVEDSCECDVTDSTVNEKAGDELVDPMESSVTLPDPPSPSLLDDLEEKVSNNSDAESSESDSMLPAFGPSTPVSSSKRKEILSLDNNGNESEEIEF